MSKVPKPVRLGFERDCVEIPLDLLHVTTPLPPGLKGTAKYLQIRSSVHAIGLVEPIVVTQNKELAGTFLVLDGRMRLEALRDLAAKTVLCLISTDDEGYTYNKRVNRLSTIQEHKMIVRAAERGVSVKRLSDALGISEDAIHQRFKLLNGVCNEAITLLADKPVPMGVFSSLRQMKPFRQIDVAQTMNNLNNYSLKLVFAMLQGSAPDQLVEEAAIKMRRSGMTETLQRLERELAAVQADTKLLEEGYGPANLQLVIIKTYIKSLLDNATVVRWLAKTRAEYLQQIQLIADIKQLPVQ
ncbi:plasmid partitioning protein RepB C-terminal domain-containing protein [Polaromonas sp. JS666]|uniref:ParB/RepB/Spo0J family partition protein n=1 Tax=Polaromonas sp. (strain JS666 / ATCC BAA-500) TaxID=296591 RepID=UPI0008821675|nr:plasmid partitioning protein RepB C-terminal domain-containing protein [Polaromonas sp. JS666]SDN51041.1 ParB-like nuclease domain-containing protein [Polaromonas sp. JS666]